MSFNLPSLSAILAATLEEPLQCSGHRIAVHLSAWGFQASFDLDDCLWTLLETQLSTGELSSMLTSMALVSLTQLNMATWIGS